MLLHRLSTEWADARSRQPPRPFYAISNIPRLSVWRWVLPLSCFDAISAFGFPGASLFWAPPSPHPFGGQALGGGLVSLILWLFAAGSQGLYQPLEGPQTEFRFAPVLTACLVWLGCAVLLLVTISPRAANERLLALAVLQIGMILVTHWYWHERLRTAVQKGSCLERTLFLGSTSEAARAAAAAVEKETGGRIRAVASVPMPGTAGAPSTAWVEDAVSGRTVDRIFITGFEHFSTALLTILPCLAALDIDITLLADSATMPRGAVCVTRIGSLQAIQLATRPLAPLQATMKRLTDVVVASVTLATLSPLLLAIAAAIKFDSAGPVFFVQGRIGFQGGVFKLIKFRTMYHHATEETAVLQTSRADSRVTRVGRALRRLSLDELPQLVNVIRGDMSIVGPRPHALGMTVGGRHLRDVSATYTTRHRVKPGITGWAQINNCRGEVTCEKTLNRRVILDCEYIERWSFGMDIWIMMRTVALLAFDRRAY